MACHEASGQAGVPQPQHKQTKAGVSACVRVQHGCMPEAAIGQIKHKAGHAEQYCL